MFTYPPERTTPSIRETPRPGNGLIREAVGIFTDEKALAEAIAELESTAFPRHDISVLPAGQPLSARRAEDDPNAPRTILIRPEERTIASGVIIGGGAYAGAMTSALLSTGAGFAAYLFMIFFGMLAGASLGGLIVYALATRFRQTWDVTLNSGGTVLWVRTPGEKEENLACQIMRRHGAQDVHIHNVS